MVMKKEMKDRSIQVDYDSYVSLNATVKLFDSEGNFQFHNDLLAAKKIF